MAQHHPQTQSQNPQTKRKKGGKQRPSKNLLGYRPPHALLDELGNVAAVCVLHHNVDFLPFLLGAIEADNVRMLQAPHKLNLSPRLVGHRACTGWVVVVNAANQLSNKAMMQHYSRGNSQP